MNVLNKKNISRPGADFLFEYNHHRGQGGLNYVTFFDKLKRNPNYLDSSLKTIERRTKMKASRIPLLMMTLFLSFFLIDQEALADYRNYCQWGWGMHPGMMGWGWVGLLFMLVFWVLIVVLIILLIRRLLSPGTARMAGPPQEDSALEILKKRYARGEIDKEEFEAKKKDLS
jgi:putative membrane protein